MKQHGILEGERYRGSSMKHNLIDCSENGLHELSEVEIAIAWVIVPL